MSQPAVEHDEEYSRLVDRDFSAELRDDFRGGRCGPLAEDSFLEVGSSSDEGDKVGALTDLHRSWAASRSL